MSRSGYTDDCDDLQLWRGSVERALRGKRGQAFLRECLAALDALPEPRLEATVLVSETGCCAMGAVAKARGLDVSEVEPDDRYMVALRFGLAEAMVAEIAYINDECGPRRGEETPEERFVRVRAWVEENIMEKQP